MWIDAHAHLYDASELELTDCINRAAQKDVAVIVNTATNICSSHTIIGQCRTHDCLFGAAGISPFDVEQLDSDWQQQLFGLLAEPKIIALGEIGLDNSNPAYPPLNRQVPVFEAQLAIGLQAHVPVILHSRGAEQLVFDICKSMHVTHALFHCFTGEKAVLRKILDCGYSVSFSGIITFPKTALEEVVRAAPADRIFIETDTPFLTPHPHRGKQNEPAFVGLIGARVAQIKALAPETLAKRIQDNFSQFFNLPVSLK